MIQPTQAIAVKILELDGKPCNELAAMIDWSGDSFLLIRSGGSIEAVKAKNVKLSSNVQILPATMGAIPGGHRAS